MSIHALEHHVYNQRLKRNKQLSFLNNSTYDKTECAYSHSEDSSNSTWITMFEWSQRRDRILNLWTVAPCTNHYALSNWQNNYCSLSDNHTVSRQVVSINNYCNIVHYIPINSIHVYNNFFVFRFSQVIQL